MGHQFYSAIATSVLVFGALFWSLMVFVGQSRLQGVNISVELHERANPAVLLRCFGFMIAVSIASFAGAYRPEGLSFVSDVESAVIAVISATIAIVASRYVSDHFILHGVNNTAKVVNEYNVAVAIVEFSTYIATAMMFAGGLQAETKGITVNVLLFVVGQAFLVGVGYVYSVLNRRIYDGIIDGEASCALELAGILISAGLVLSVAVKSETIVSAFVGIVIWLVFMAMTWLFCQYVTVKRSRLTTTLVDGHNWVLGFGEGLFYLTVTAAYVYIHSQPIVIITTN
jgi:hypothetical protein